MIHESCDAKPRERSRERVRARSLCRMFRIDAYCIKLVVRRTILRHRHQALYEYAHNQPLADALSKSHRNNVTRARVRIGGANCTERLRSCCRE
jgi:hypothetical protein